jgi:hypothetical protein
MTNDDVKQLTALLALELDAAQQGWAKAITKVESEANAKGRFHSGARIVMTAECLSDGLVQHRQFIFAKWTTYIRPRFASLSAADQTAFVDAALEAFDKAIAAAIAQLAARPKPSPHIDFSGPIKETGERERRSLEAELRLYMSTPVDSPAGANVTNVVTHGSNSPVNVGSGTLNQQVNVNEAIAELVTALAGLLEAMKDQPRLDEVRDIVIEAKDEAAKPRPNKLRLRSILGGAKDALQGVAAVQPAWETVHRALQMLGLAV